jgi:lipoteichoic acid synthase
MTPNLNINKKIKNSINYFNEYILYLLFGISIVLKCMFFQLNSQIGTKIGNFSIVLSSIGILLIIFSILFLIRSNVRMIVVFVVYLLLSILLLSDAVYFKYYSNVITISLLKLSAFAGDVTGSIAGLLEFKDIFYVIDVPLFIILMILTSKRTKNEFVFLKRLKVTFFVLVFGFLVLAVPYSFSTPRTYKFDQGKAIKEMGVLYYHYYDTKKYFNDYVLRSKDLTFAEKERMSDFYKNKAAQDKKIVNKRYTGIAKGKNLIVIQVEALQQFAVNRVYNGQEVTPNLNKLIKNNIYFKNFYYQARSGNTADAEFLTNNSMYSFQHMAGIPYVNYPNNKYNSLAKALKSEGYNTYAFHGYKGSFWNRATMYQSLGFEKFTSMKDFSKNKNFGMGINDIDFFKESLDKLQKMHKDNKPFFSFFVTLSSHYSYDNFEGKYPFNIKGLEGTTVGKFLRAANYADKAIASFIADLKKRGLYDNTLIVIYGDHNAVGKMQYDEMKKLLNKTNISDLEWEQLQKVPCIITGGPITNKMAEVVNTTGGEIDTMPTIANLMDFKVPYAIGKDLLNTKFGDGYAFSVGRDDTFVTDKYCYVDSLGKAYDLKTGRELKAEEYKDMLDYGHNTTYMTDTIISKNAFKTFSLGK